MYRMASVGGRAAQCFHFVVEVIGNLHLFNACAYDVASLLFVRVFATIRPIMVTVALSIWMAWVRGNTPLNVVFSDSDNCRTACSKDGRNTTATADLFPFPVTCGRITHQYRWVARRLGIMTAAVQTVPSNQLSSSPARRVGYVKGVHRLDVNMCSFSSPSFSFVLLPIPIPPRRNRPFTIRHGRPPVPVGWDRSRSTTPASQIVREDLRLRARPLRR